MYVFSKNWYLYKYPDVAKSGYKDDPYIHYVKYGKSEGRLPIPPIPKEYNEEKFLDFISSLWNHWHFQFAAGDARYRLRFRSCKKFFRTEFL